MGDDKQQCPICTCEAFDRGTFANGHVIECVRCGLYAISPTLEATWPARRQQNKNAASVASTFIRRHQHARTAVPVTTYTLDALEKEAPDDLADQYAALLLWIGENQPSPVEWATAHPSSIAATIGAHKMIARPPEAEDGLQWLLQQTINDGVYLVQQTALEYRFQLTMRGWSRFSELSRRAEESRTAFMAMKFGEQDLQALLDNHFRRAVQETGFDLRILTDGQGAGLIDNQIRTAIRRAAFVVADLTHDNNGAYFEAGFAEGIGLHVIYTCRADKFKEKKTHFDTNHMVTIPWDPLDMPAAANQLKNMIRATLPTTARMSDDERAA